MHLPDGILSGHVEIAGAAMAAGGIAIAGHAAVTRSNTRAELAVSPGRIAGVGALVFAAQMVNVPVASGTSGHLIGAALAVTLLGPAIGALTLAAVVAAQAMVFADGGVTSLGVNLLTLALVPTLVAWAVLRGARADRAAALGRVAAASAASVLAGVMLFNLLYAVGALGGEGAWAVSGHMLAVHMPMLVLEAAITVAGVALLRRFAARPIHLAVGALAVAVLAAPFASTAPDGLERVGHERGFLGLANDSLVASSPVADYELAGVSNSLLAVALAGALGVALVMAMLGSSTRLAVRRQRA